MNTYSITDQGRARSMNQDRFSNYFSSHFTLLLLADGMGGHNAGEVAAERAIDAARTFMMQNKDRDDFDNLLVEAVLAANSAVFEAALQESAYAHMGTTLCAVLLVRDSVYVAHVGDSRVYLLHENAMKQVTRDHSVVSDLLAQGILTPEEAEMHPDRNTLTRAVGTETNVVVDIREFPAEEGDIWLLASDGLTKMVDDATILKTIAEANNLRGAAEELVKLANHHGGADNITLTLYKIGETDATNPPE